MTFFNLLSQILVCCCNYPYINLYDFVASNTHYFAFLDYTKEFHLKVQWHLPYFIEKEGAIVGKLEYSRLSTLRCSSKVSRLISEKFTFQQVCRQGRTVYCDKLLIPDWRCIMDCLCYEFLAGTTLSRNENRRL